MKLNYDCIRDVLLELEENLTIEEISYDLGKGKETKFEFSFINIDRLAELERLKKYSKKDIFYSINKLEEAGYIIADSIPGDDSLNYLICDITYAGHEFLQSIKPETVWDDVKNITSKVGTISIPIISSIASNVLTQIISRTIGMN